MVNLFDSNLTHDCNVNINVIIHSGMHAALHFILCSFGDSGRNASCYGVKNIMCNRIKYVLIIIREI